MADSLWYKNAVFYEVYVRAYADSNADGHGDLKGLISRLDYLANLGVDCLWLLPIYPSPLKDDGYDIADYYGVLREYGDIADFRTLISETHRRGMRVVADLVLNHTSDQHPWFQAARSDLASPYRDYYVWSDTDQKYAQARVIFIDSLKSNWTWDEQAGQYFWHRFYPSQPDLNFDHPQVQQEMLEVARFWLEMGIDGFRADAVPYLFEREGTNGENLPETHAYLKRLRAFIDQHFPGRVLLCEANQWPQDVREYFGDGDEFQMGFHFPLMPRLYMAIRQADRSPLVWALERTPSLPESCQWCVFLRNHDELTLEMVTEEERQWMWQEYAPDPRMRLNQGIRRRLAPLLDNDHRKIELAYSLLFSLPGSPVIYYGDEIGMGDNIQLPDRNGVRTPMQWNSSASAGFSSASPAQFYAPIIQDEGYGPGWVNVEDQLRDPGSLLNRIRQMISVRKAYPLMGEGGLRWQSTDNQAIAAYWREGQNMQAGKGESPVSSSVLVLNNLSPQFQPIHIELPVGTRAQDLLDGSEIEISPAGQWIVELGPYAYRWLEISAGE